MSIKTTVIALVSWVIATTAYHHTAGVPLYEAAGTLGVFFVLGMCIGKVSVWWDRRKAREIETLMNIIRAQAEKDRHPDPFHREAGSRRNMIMGHNPIVSPSRANMVKGHMHQRPVTRHAREDNTREWDEFMANSIQDPRERGRREYDAEMEARSTPLETIGAVIGAMAIAEAVKDVMQDDDGYTQEDWDELEKLHNTWGTPGSTVTQNPALQPHAHSGDGGTISADYVEPVRSYTNDVSAVADNVYTSDTSSEDSNDY